MLRIAAVAFASLVFVVACGGDSPTAPSYPQVAGVYTGTITITAAGDSLDGSGRLDVAQSDSEVTIAGTVTVLGETVQLPSVTGRINMTGFFTPTAGGDATAGYDATCGAWRYSSATISFSGRSMRLTGNGRDRVLRGHPADRHPHAVSRRGLPSTRPGPHVVRADAARQRTA